MITTADASLVLARALCCGADFAELFFEHTQTRSMRYLDGRVYEATGGVLHGAGVRVMLGRDCAYATTNDTSLLGLQEVALRAAMALGELRAVGGEEPVKLYQTLVFDRHRAALPLGDVTSKRQVHLLRDLHNAVRDCPGISQAAAGCQLTTQHVTIANSTGLYIRDERNRARVSIQAVAGDGSQNQTAFQGPGALRGAEFLDSIDPEALGRETAEVALTMLHAPECPAGRFPVVMAGGFGGVLIHEACVHSLEATSVSRGASEFADKLGRPIADPCVTIIDDGTIPNAWGSGNIDDEGNQTQRNVLVRDGVLEGFLVDTLGGRKMGMAPNGCARRQSYAYAPTSRMSNTFVEAGQSSEQEMFAAVDHGLYAKRMGGGSVSPATGEFNFAVAEGYWIENGKITHPVRGATLVGRGSEVLMNINKVGREVTFGQGMCGSRSGTVPTDVGQPTLLLRELTVGGRG